MTVKLTPELLEWAYELVNHTEPFNKWNLPDGHEITFTVTKSASTCGDYTRNADGSHRIRISSRCIGTLPNLIEVMAHEMVHLHQARTGMETRGIHNAAFMKLATQVCRVHKFDPKGFA